MYRRTESSDWMWAEACDLIERAERMHRQFFRLVDSPRHEAAWQPPADVFEDEREVVIVVAMPGVSADRVEVTVAPGEVVVRAERPISFGALRHVVRQLEIPYGHFERRIALAHGSFEAVSHEFTDGCLILRLRKES